MVTLWSSSKLSAFPVNSALLSRRNHSADNGFLFLSKETTERKLREKHYIPIGVSLNMPFCNSKHPHLAFVYEFEDEIYWIHMPMWYWYKYMFEYGGYKCPCEEIKKLERAYR